MNIKWIATTAAAALLAMGGLNSPVLAQSSQQNPSHQGSSSSSQSGSSQSGSNQSGSQFYHRPDNQGRPAIPGDADYSQAMDRLFQAAQRLRESVQALAQKPAGTERTRAMDIAREALLETQQAMVLAYDANLKGSNQSSSSQSGSGQSGSGQANARSNSGQSGGSGSSASGSSSGSSSSHSGGGSSGSNSSGSRSSGSN